MPRWRQDHVTGELIEISNGPICHHHSVSVFDSFVSHVDGTTIRNSDDLRAHNNRHGVSNDPDSLREQTAQQDNRQHTTGSRQERIAAIRDSMERVQSSGFHREIIYDE